MARSYINILLKHFSVEIFEKYLNFKIIVISFNNLDEKKTILKYEKILHL